MREAALIAINIIRNIDSNQVGEEEFRLSSAPKIEDKTSFHSKNYEMNMNPPIREIFERYKNINLPQSRQSVGKSQPQPQQNIYKKYLSDQKTMPEDLKTNSYMNSPQSQYYENKYGSSNYNKANSTNGNINIQKSNILNENGEDGRNSSKDIGQHDMDYLFNKMEIIMIQQNKIYENFVNFETEIKGEMQALKEKVAKIENAVYSPQQEGLNNKQRPNYRTFNDNNDRLSAMERPAGMNS